MQNGIDARHSRDSGERHPEKSVTEILSTIARGTLLSITLRWRCGECDDDPHQYSVESPAPITVRWRSGEVGTVSVTTTALVSAAVVGRRFEVGSIHILGGGNVCRSAVGSSEASESAPKIGETGFGNLRCEGDPT